MKQLPTSFAIQCNNPESLLWRKYIEWYNKTFNCKVLGTTTSLYYGCIIHNGETLPERSDHILKFNNNTVVLTLEEWYSIVNGNDDLKEKEADFEKGLKTLIDKNNTLDRSDEYYTKTIDRQLRTFAQEVISLYKQSLDNK